MKTKRLFLLLTGLVLILTLAACGAGGQNGSQQSSDTQAVTENMEEASDTEGKTSEPAASQEETDDLSAKTGADSEVLVVVFSATGTTKRVAEMIASIEGADLYEITPAQPYSDADLDWNDSDSRTTKEQNDESARPEIGSETIDLSAYSKIYVGYPIWWGEEPRIMDTFVESYDFGNATVIPFCTSASSGIGSSGKNLAENAGSGSWLDGERFSGTVSEDELKSWIEGL